MNAVFKGILNSLHSFPIVPASINLRMELGGWGCIICPLVIRMWSKALASSWFSRQIQYRWPYQWQNDRLMPCFTFQNSYSFYTQFWILWYDVGAHVKTKVFFYQYLKSMVNSWNNNPLTIHIKNLNIAALKSGSWTKLNRTSPLSVY